MKNIKKDRKDFFRMKSRRSSEGGFTIIEVLIVLAIAGLIMLIVFLAVPALQRNSRNTQRSNDASRISAAVNECLNNRNGRMNDCDGFGAGAEAGQYITIADNQQLTALGGATLNTFAFTVNTRCDAAGANAVPGGGTRAFTVTYQVETSAAPVNRCIGS